MDGRVSIPFFAGLNLSLHPQPALVVSGAAPVLQIISSRPLLPREVVRTNAASVDIISTSHASAAPALIPDSELLASYHPGRAALPGSHHLDRRGLHVSMESDQHAARCARTCGANQSDAVGERRNEVPLHWWSGYLRPDFHLCLCSASSTECERVSVASCFAISASLL